MLKLLKHLTNAPVAVSLAFLLVGAPSAPGSLLLSPPAWADESDDDDEHDDVEEVVVTEEREDRSNHRTGGGTGQQTQQLLGSANYDYYGSVQCPTSAQSANTAGPGCSCPEGMEKNETSDGGAWCEPRRPSCAAKPKNSSCVCPASQGRTYDSDGFYRCCSKQSVSDCWTPGDWGMFCSIAGKHGAGISQCMSNEEVEMRIVEHLATKYPKTTCAVVIMGTAVVGTWKKGVAGRWIKTAAYAGSIACARVYFDDEFDD